MTIAGQGLGVQNGTQPGETTKTQTRMTTITQTNRHKVQNRSTMADCNRKIGKTADKPSTAQAAAIAKARTISRRLHQTPDWGTTVAEPSLQLRPAAETSILISLAPSGILLCDKMFRLLTGF